MIPRMWDSEVYSYDGRFFSIPPTHIVPKPVQQPHPPIFAACSKPEDAAAVRRAHAYMNEQYLHPALLGHYPPEVKEIFELLGVYQIFPVVQTRQQALDYFAKKVR